MATAADGLGVSPLEVALAWVRDRPGVTAPILGARTAGQLHGALPAERADAARRDRQRARRRVRDRRSATRSARADRRAGRAGGGVTSGGLAQAGALGSMERMDYEYAPLRLPSNVDRLTAAAQLAIQAEFSGWELARVRLFRDGTRQVMLRRRQVDQPQPGLSY